MAILNAYSQANLKQPSFIIKPLQFLQDLDQNPYILKGFISTTTDLLNTYSDSTNWDYVHAKLMYALSAVNVLPNYLSLHKTVLKVKYFIQ